MESGLHNPLKDSWMLKTLIKGVKREKGGHVNRKLPITIDILKQIAACLDLRNSQQLTFWAACLVSFFGMMRKSSLFPSGQNSYLEIRNSVVCSWGLSIHAEYSKTIQFRDRKAFISLPWHQNKLLCPARALLRALQVAGCYQDQDFIFSFQEKGTLKRMTYAMFTSLLRTTLLRLGLPLHSYSGHSFRRGGATHAFKAGVAPEMIKSQGDWKSLSYLDYLDVSNARDRAECLSAMFQ